MGDAGTLSVQAQDTLTGAGVQTVTGAKTFKDQKLLLRNPADTFTATILNPALTASANLEMEVSPGGSDIAYVYKDRGGNYVCKNSRTGVIISGPSVTPDAAIVAALSVGSVRFSGDDFILSGSFAGFTIGANCTISCAASTFITVPNGYTGYVFKMGTGNPNYWSGAQFREAGTAAKLWTAFRLESSSGIGVNTTIENVRIQDAGTGILILVSNIAGFVNSSFFKDIRIFNPVIGIDFQDTAVTWAGQIGPTGQNVFVDVWIQCNASTLYGFKNIRNSDNIFIGCKTWDTQLGNGGAGCYRSTFHADNVAGSNIIIGGIMTGTIGTHWLDPSGSAFVVDQFTGFRPAKDLLGNVNLGNNVYQIISSQARLKQGGSNQFYIRNAADNGYGNLRLENLQFFSMTNQAGTTAFCTNDGTVITWLQGIKHDAYIDQKTVTIPADPASTYTRRYAKVVDANNDGLFVKRKVNGAVVEVQL